MCSKIVCQKQSKRINAVLLRNKSFRLWELMNMVKQAVWGAIVLVVYVGRKKTYRRS